MHFKTWIYSRLIFGISGVGLFAQVLAAQVPGKVDFARDIQPLLRENCVECHGPSQQMKGFRLDRRKDVMPNRVGANGARIVPGDSSRSMVYARLSTNQSGMQMPPSGPLRPEQICPPACITPLMRLSVTAPA